MNLEDPRLTAFALGELPENDRTEIEQLISRSPYARRFVAEIRALGAQLKVAFDAEPASPVVRHNILPAPGRNTFWWDSAWMSVRVAALLVTAALLAAVIFGTLYFRGGLTRISSRENTPPPAIILESPEPSIEGQLPFAAEQIATASPRKGGEGFVSAATNPVSSFSLIANGASFEVVRALIQRGEKPAKDTIEIEGLVNAFAYDYGAPVGDAPFAINLESGACPWAPTHRLVRIALQPRATDQIDSIVAGNVIPTVEFNPTSVSSYRLIGYDRPSEGSEPGKLIAGRSVTAFYEIVPTNTQANDSMLTAKVNFTRPNKTNRETIVQAFTDSRASFEQTSPDFRFAAAVAEFGLVLRGEVDSSAMSSIIQIAEATNTNKRAERIEFIRLVRAAEKL